MSEGFIYAVRTDGGAVKIGWSSDPVKRFAKIQSDCPVPVRLVGYMRGSVSDESMLHDRFYPHLLRGEWYEEKDAVAKFVESLPGHVKRRKSVVSANHPSNVLAAWIKENNHTIYSFANLIGSTGASVSRWCAGKCFPSSKYVQAIVAATGGEVGPHDLLTWLDGAGEASA